jgi:hypothetical protein
MYIVNMWQYFTLGCKMEHVGLKGDGWQKGAQPRENIGELSASGTQCSPLRVGDPRFTVMSNNAVEVTLKRPSERAQSQLRT